MYKSIYNDPDERANITHSWVYWDQAFTAEELDSIVNYCKTKGTEASGIIGSTDPAEVEKVRISNVKFHKRDDTTAWIFDRFNDIIARLNERFYGFNLNGYDSFQYTEYSSERQGKYDWHMDTELGRNSLGYTRKLSVVLNLSKPDIDYEGGEFCINVSSESMSEKVEFPRGRIVAFPSFLLHRVSPVTKGVRRSLVIWVTGPKFI